MPLCRFRPAPAWAAPVRFDGASASPSAGARGPSTPARPRRPRTRSTHPRPGCCARRRSGEQRKRQLIDGVLTPVLLVVPDAPRIKCSDFLQIRKGEDLFRRNTALTVKPNPSILRQESHDRCYVARYAACVKYLCA